MPSNTSIRSNSNAIKARAPASAPKRPTSAEYVKKYTEYLATGHQIRHALQRLYDLNCSIQVFEECLTEKVILQKYTGQSEYQYPVTLLMNKFDDLRKREIRVANEKWSKNGELSAAMFTNKMVMEQRMKDLEKMDQKTANNLFVAALGDSCFIPKKKVDYSKFKITKRSKSSTSTSPSSSSSETSSPIA